MMNQVTNTETADSRLSWIYKISGVAALITGILFLIAMIGLITEVLQPSITNGWLSPFENNWLIVIFKLHAGSLDIHDDPLHGLNLIDIAILALVGTLCFGLRAALGKASKIWSSVAFALSLITIILFIATHIAGRSTVMLSVLIFSFVMLRNNIFGKATIYAGILAGIFLFVGDLTVGVHSNIITILFSIGYVLLITWFFLIAQSLFRLGGTS